VDVLILHDALPDDSRADESDTLHQAELVEQALRQLGHRASRLPCDLDLDQLRRALLKRRPDCVFNLVETPGRRGAWIHLPLAVVEGLGIPCTGVEATGMVVSSNKLACKRLLRLAGLPTPDWHTRRSLQRHAEPVSGTWILKSVWEHGSVGLDEHSVVDVDDAGALEELLAEREPELAGLGFAEAYVDGREFNIAVLVDARGRPRVLPHAEIAFEGYEAGRRRVVGYRAKWVDDSFEAVHTPRSFDFPDADDALLAQLGGLATGTWDVFELAGHVRVDFRVDGAGEPWIIDVNANPCLSPDAGFAAAATRAGLADTDVVALLLDDALARRGSPAVADVARHDTQPR
jgi:D-alanine-D-alanine ligase